MINCWRCGASCKFSENTINGRYILIDLNTERPHSPSCTNTYKSNLSKPMKIRVGPGFEYMTKEEMAAIKERVDKRHAIYLSSLRELFKPPA